MTFCLGLERNVDRGAGVAQRDFIGNQFDLFAILLTHLDQIVDRVVQTRRKFQSVRGLSSDVGQQLHFPAVLRRTHQLVLSVLVRVLFVALAVLSARRDAMALRNMHSRACFRRFRFISLLELEYTQQMFLIHVSRSSLGRVIHSLGFEDFVVSEAISFEYFLPFLLARCFELADGFLGSGAVDSVNTELPSDEIS